MINVSIIIEALFVGLYTQGISYFIKNIFLLGFIKHLLGHYLNLHTYYCKYGNACLKIKKYSKDKVSIIQLIVESILEGFLFIIMNNITKNKFLIGLLLHLIFDVFGLHRIFCLFRCV